MGQSSGKNTTYSMLCSQLLDIYPLKLRQCFWASLAWKRTLMSDGPSISQTYTLWFDIRSWIFSTAASILWTCVLTRIIDPVCISKSKNAENEIGIRKQLSLLPFLGFRHRAKFNALWRSCSHSDFILPIFSHIFSVNHVYLKPLSAFFGNKYVQTWT